MKKITLLFFMSLMSFCAYAQLPLEGFEGTWPPTGWNIYDNGIGPAATWMQSQLGNPTQPPYAGDHAAFLNKENVATGIPEDWLVTPAFNVQTNAQLRFYSRLTTPADDGSIYRIMIIPASMDASVLGNYTQVQQWTEFEINPVQTVYTEKVVAIPAAYVGQSVRLAFVMAGDNGDRWLVDNVRVVQQCLDPTSLGASNFGLTTATLTWTNPGAATSFEVEIVQATATPTGTGTVTTGTSYAATGLQSATNYKFYVRSICPDGGTSNWVGPFYFSTVAPGATCAAPITIGSLPYTTTNNTSGFGDDYNGSPGASGCGSTNGYLNGDDVVYAYTPATSGNISAGITNIGTFAGLFVYNSCANIGVSCIAGGVSGGTTNPVAIPTIAVTAGTTYYFVISTWATPQSTPYTLTIQQVFCAPPVGQATTNINATSATLNWTNPSSATSWQLALQPAGTGLPTGAGTTVTTNAYPATGLNPATSYEYYVRADCNDGNFSAWAGPYTFNTTQIPATLPFTQNFEGAASFTLNNGTQPNKWVIGSATSNSPANSLYISNDNGTTNSFNVGSTSVVQAYRDIQMPASVDQLALSFDWKGQGEACCDYLRVWIVPASFTPTPGTQIAAGANRIQLGGNYNMNGTWTTVNQVFNGTAYAGQVLRVVFEWRNDGSLGTQPPAAVDNINLSLITCPSPTALTISNLQETQATFTWTAPTSVTPTYDYYLATSNTAPTAGSTPTGNVATNTVTVNSLTPSTAYWFWVRSNCGPGDTSFWVGPVAFNTPQIPAAMDYSTDFEGTVNWTLNNGTQTNKWVIGTATSNSPTHSLYISNDNGVSNAFNVSSTSVVQAYRDISVPANGAQASLSFDWKGQGEGCCDYLRVWLVPVTFTPTAGTQIAAGTNRIQVGGNYNMNGTWTTVNQVVNVSAYAGQIVRLVFEWRNDGSLGTQPPAAVDNVNFSLITCPSPSALTLSNLQLSQATISWTAPSSGTPTYDYYLSTTNTAPVAGTTPTGNVATTSATVTSLTPSTTYYFWVRSNCGAGDNSFWIGPLSFTTPQVPATMDYSEDFEGAINWTLNNGTQTNKWIVGTATSNSPTHSLYVTNDAGVSNAFNITSTSVVQAYRDIAVPTGAVDASLSFDWKGQGEACCDYMRVWLVPITFTPTAGTQITAGANRIQVGGNYNMNGTWTTVNQVLNISAYAGQTLRLVFEWRNDGSIGTQPPAAVDNVNLSLITCYPPSALTLNDLQLNQATISWTAPAIGTPTYDYFLVTDNTIPNDATVPTGNVATTSTTVTPLQPSSNYFFWVRSNCGPDDTSFWIGPLAFSTPQIPAEMDFTEDFEGAINWTLNNGTQTNKWVVGTATSNSPTHSLYISNDNGINNAYALNSTSVVHAYRDINVPATASDCNLSFDWKSLGENGWDYMRVWIVPVAFNPVTGTQITAGANRIQIGGNYSNNNTWTTVSQIMDMSAYAGQTIRLVFEWRNDGGGGTQPPAAVDNVNFTVITCPQPSDLIAEGVDMESVNVSWTPGGSETQWEVIVQLATEPAPGASPTNSVIVTGDPEYLAEGLTPSIFYEFYVRAICGPDDTSFWSGPQEFSIFSPPGCANIDLLNEDLEIIAPDSQVTICPGEESCMDFSASYYETGETTEYTVESIDYQPPYPFLGGIELNVTTDDIWSPVFDLPFDFCFYGETYDEAKVGSNGVVMFGDNMTDAGNCPWAYTQSIPNTGFPIKNAIYGVYQDINPAVDGSNVSINYQVLGTYPCRALVVNYYDVPQFQCGLSVGTQTSQIVIYEISNIIEVYVETRTPCTSWQNGVGVIGIQNAAGTLATVPPGRNTGAWTATNEAWRFVPSGESNVEFEWLKDGVFFSNQDDINVCVDAQTTMTARATYTTCTGEELVRESSFTINVADPIEANEPQDLTMCSSGEEVTFDLTDALEGIMDDTTGYNFTFYASEDAANAGLTDNLAEMYTTDTSETIWIRITQGESPCYITRSFELILNNVPPQFTASDDITVCEGTPVTLEVFPGNFDPNDPAVSFSWTLDGNDLGLTTQTITVTEPGVYEVTVNNGGCVGTEEIVVNTNPAPAADAPDDVTACDSYTLPALTNGNYYTGTGGTGTMLNAGDVITTTQTIYVYAATTAPVCTTENSFVVTINDTPVVTTPGDQSVCDSYTLPALTVGNYYTAAGGTGTMLNANDPITATQTIYVYAETGTTPNCSDEESFTVTVTPSPVAQVMADVTVCDSYALPALDPGNSYYTEAGGNGTQLNEGDLITSTQEIHILAQSGTTPNCTGESSFTVTVNQTPVIVNPGDQAACDSYVLPSLATGNYYSGPGATGTLYNSGQAITSSQTIYIYAETATVPNCSAEEMFNVTITASPVAQVLPDVTECGSYTLPALDAGNSYYTAANGGGDALSAGDVVTTTQTIYILAQTGGATNCTGESSFLVTINPVPDFNLGGPYVTCVASNATVSVSANNFNTADATYSWTVNGNPSTETGPSIVATEFGTYEVTISLNGCTATKGISVTQDTSGVAVMYEEGCDGGDYKLTALPIDSSFNPDTVSYSWTGPNGFSQTGSEVTVPSAGMYTVTVTTTDGCIGSIEINVTDTSCSIPRGISPNGDDKNDTFDLTSLGVRKISIFNRYGKEVFSYGAYTDQWHGQTNSGDELPTGTYFYSLERSNGESKTGWVYINRQD